MMTWNRERKRTRDRLLDYDYRIVPPHPHSAGMAVVYPIEEPSIPFITDIPNTTLPSVYPWENLNFYNLVSELYKLAVMGGFVGSLDEFLHYFANYSSNKEIIYDNYENFPKVGRLDKLYFDLDENILYYYEDKYLPVKAAQILDENNE